MNRDKKLGLALGVLLVGIVGAFFFRNEPRSLPALPRLENPKLLDDRIAEKPMVPYPAEMEALPSRRPSVPAKNAAHREWSIETEDPWEASPVTHEELASSRPRPEPIRIKPDAASEKSTQSENREWSALPERTKPTVSAGAGTRIHEVKPGETLSGISVKYLGTQTRYPEILEANKDQLKAPKDLRAGMKIRIPATNAERLANSADRPALEPIQRSKSKGGTHRGEVEKPDDSQEHIAGRAKLTTRNVSSNPTNEDLEDESTTEPKDPVARLTPTIEAFDSDEKPFGIDPAESTAPNDNGFPNRKSSDSPPTNPPTRRNPFLPRYEAGKPAGSGSSSSNRTFGQKTPESLESRDPASPPPSTVSRTSPPPREAEPLSSTSNSSVRTQPSASGSTEPHLKGSVKSPSLAPGRYLVQRGDSLEKISQRLFGDKDAVQKILEANRDVLTNANELRPGMSLKIPY